MKNKQKKFKSSNLLDPRILEKARDSGEILSYTIEFLKRFDSFGAVNIARMIFTDRLFYSLTNSKYGDYTPENILEFTNGIKKLLNFDLKNGYMDFDLFQNSLFVRLSYTIFPELRKANLSKAGSAFTLLNLTHVFNFCLLIIIKEISILELDLPEDQRNEVYYDLLQIRDQLIGKISSGLRKALTAKRYGFGYRIITGFDTEFSCIELCKNELLASTQSIYPRLFLKIRRLNSINDIHWGYNDFNTSTPLDSLMSDVYTLITFIRFLKGCSDDIINCLVTELKKLEGSKLDYFNDVRGDFFSIKKQMTHGDFINIFTNHLENPGEYSLKFLVESSLLKSKEVLDKDLILLLSIMDELGLGKAVINKTRIRFPALNLSFPKSSELTLLAHYTTADISLWSDFESIKSKLKILGKNYVTLGRGLRIEGINTKIELRDTSLLTPSGKSLAAVGSLYNDPLLRKIELPRNSYNNMKVLMKEEAQLFRDYALRDSIITLYHGLKTEELSYATLNSLTVPVTLSSMAGNIIAKELDMSKFSPEVIDPLYSFKDIAKIMTPAGVELSKQVACYLPYFLGSYHGGRNESFAYGIFPGEWYDFDLPGAYSTAMSLLNYPAYDEIVHISNIDAIEVKERFNLVNSYSSFNVSFDFPRSVMYPNLPVRIDGGSIIFPSTGVSYCTGLEILLALNLGATVMIDSGYLIPWEDQSKSSNSSVSASSENYGLDDIIIDGILKIAHSSKIAEIFKSGGNKNQKVSNFFKDSDGFSNLEPKVNELCRLEREAVGVLGVDDNVPLFISDKVDETSVINFKQHSGFLQSDFFNLMKRWTEKRKLYPRNSYHNLFYKFLANSGIGQLARGLSRKPAFDPGTNSTQPIPASQITNPLYGGWVTSFIRCVISELMNQLHEKGFFIISVTTDGFITNCSNPLELEKLFFSAIYSDARLNLSGNDLILELKTRERNGIISWSTRGQLGLESDLKAATGFQSKSFKHEDLVNLFQSSFNHDKTIHYLQFSLRSATDIFKKGGSVSGKYQERDFKLVFDNRREILSDGLKSRPWNNVETCKLARFISKMDRRKFSETSFLPAQDLISGKTTYINTAIRLLIRAFYHSNSIFGYEFTVSIDRKFINSELKDLGINVSLNYISKQKQVRFIKNAVPLVDATKVLVDKIKQKYPNFDEGQFFKDFKPTTDQNFKK